MPTRIDMPAKLSTLRSLKRATETDLRAARKVGSWQAVATLRRFLAQILEAVEASEERESSSDGLSDEELVAQFREDAREMPSRHLVPFVTEYCDRFGLDMPRAILAGGAD
jgi:hypothetical protein